MKTTTILLLVGGAVVAYVLYQRSQVASGAASVNSWASGLSSWFGTPAAS